MSSDSENSDSDNFVATDSESFADTKNSTVAEIQVDVEFVVSADNYHSILDYFVDKSFSANTLQQLLPQLCLLVVMDTY